MADLVGDDSLKVGGVARRLHEPRRESDDVGGGGEGVDRALVGDDEAQALAIHAGGIIDGCCQPQEEVLGLGVAQHGGGRGGCRPCCERTERAKRKSGGEGGTLCRPHRAPPLPSGPARPGQRTRRHRRRG